MSSPCGACVCSRTRCSRGFAAPSLQPFERQSKRGPMLIDWHTNLALEEHYSEEEDEYVTRVGGLGRAGTPELHEKHVAQVCHKFVVVTMQFRRLKVHV